MKSYLEFERNVKVLEDELEKLKDPFNKEGISEVDTTKISEIQSEIDVKLKSTYANLNEWQRTQVARHEERPKAKFFIENLFTNFINLSGDRRFAEDEAVLAGFALFDGRSVLVIGQEKGDDLDNRLKRNFGMMRPEGYRKCIRLMKLANKFNIPVISFIDTPGAYPGIGAE
ncbi:MAG: acetyl-CoA carboxylase carboxyl transferase subunit alpha, partial [Alphaproteobacteria bacterium]